MKRRRPPVVVELAAFRFPPSVITLPIRWYLRFNLSFRDIEELLAERSVEGDHVSVYRGVQRFTPLLIDAARPCRHIVGDRWRCDETYVRVTGIDGTCGRSDDQFGQVIDVFISPRRDLRRGHYEVGVGASPKLRLAAAFDELATADLIGPRKRAGGRPAQPSRAQRAPWRGPRFRSGFGPIATGSAGASRPPRDFQPTMGFTPREAHSPPGTSAAGPESTRMALPAGVHLYCTCPANSVPWRRDRCSSLLLLQDEFRPVSRPSTPP